MTLSGWLGTLGIVLLAMASCRNRESLAEPSSSTRAQAVSRVAPSGSAVSPGFQPPAAGSTNSPWAGSWSGTYRAQRYPIRMDNQEALASWGKDTKEQAIGVGEIALRVDGADRVTGESAGPLGQLVITGRVEGGLVRALAIPRDPASEGNFQGLLLAKIEGSRLTGRLQVSMGDSSVVRTANMELARPR